MNGIGVENIVPPTDMTSQEGEPVMKVTGLREGDWFTLNGVRYKLISESEDYIVLRDSLGEFELPIRDIEYS